MNGSKSMINQYNSNKSFQTKFVDSNQTTERSKQKTSNFRSVTRDYHGRMNVFLDQKIEQKAIHPMI